jgi:hypothetical protein
MARSEEDTVYSCCFWKTRFLVGVHDPYNRILYVSAHVCTRGSTCIYLYSPVWFIDLVAREGANERENDAGVGCHGEKSPMQ